MTFKKNIFNSYSSSLVIPPLIKLEENLMMASFQLMKLVPAKYVLEKAIRENKIDKSTPIVETSSGTYALGIGIVCAEHNIPFRIISDPAIDDDLQKRLEDLGGEVQIITKSSDAD